MATTQQLRRRTAASPMRPRQVHEAVAGNLAEREHRAATRAQRRGLILRAGPAATGDHGAGRSYMLTDGVTGAVVAQGSRDGYGLSIDQIEEYLRACGCR